MLASVDDLIEMVGRNLSPGMGRLALQAGAAAVVADLGWNPELSVRTYSAPSFGTYILPAYNVTTVTVTDALAAPITGVIVRESAVTLPAGPIGPHLVTYTAGWLQPDMPDAISLACLEQAERWLDSASRTGKRVSSWGTGTENESVTYAILGATDSLDPRLTPWRLLPVVA